MDKRETQAAIDAIRARLVEIERALRTTDLSRISQLECLPSLLPILDPITEAVRKETDPRRKKAIAFGRRMVDLFPDRCGWTAEDMKAPSEDLIDKLVELASLIQEESPC